MGSKIKYISLIVLIFCCLLNSFLGFLTGIDWGDDFAGYVIQAQTLVSGDFEALKTNMSRNDFILNYPWGFPIVLTPVIGHFTTNLLLVKQYIFLFFVVSLLFTYLLFKREKEFALLTVLLVTCTPFFWYFKSYIFSDFPNLCFVMLSLLLIDTVVIKKEKLLNKYADQGLIGIAIFLAFAMRTQSVVLLFTLFIMQVFYLRKDLLKIVNLVSALVPYLVFFLLKLSLTMIIPIKEVSYMGIYSDTPWLSTISNNLIFYLNIWKELFKDVWILQDIDALLAGVCIFLFMIGLFVGWKNNFLFIVFSSLFTGVLILTPFYQGLRYMIPLIPIFFYFLIKGIFYVTQAFSKTNKNLIAYLLITPLFIFPFKSSIALTSEIKAQQKVMEGPNSPMAVEMFEFLKNNTPKESIIGYWKPRAMLLYSERNSIIPRDHDDCLNRQTNYYVHYKNAYGDQIPLDSILSHPTTFVIIFENNDFKIFKISKDPLALMPSEVRKLGSPEGTFIISINHSYFEPSAISEPEKTIGLYSNGAVSAKDFTLKKGKYVLSVYSKGTEAAGVKPMNRLIINNETIGHFDSGKEVGRNDFILSLNKDSNIKLELQLENDYEHNGEDRNSLVYFLNIYRQ